MNVTESERLARLEREMAILRTEFARLRVHVGAPASAPRPAQTPPPGPAPRDWSTAPTGTESAPPRPRPATEPSAPPKPRRSFEDIIGRYATIAVATVTVLVGVGIFLNWAIQNGLLGPTMRVVLGYLAAIGIAAGGMRLRMRGTREFGNVLLALALGVVHLVCWSAGPLLHVLPSPVALAIGFIASVVLAEFALRHDEQMLCAIGFGGAAIAPFVTGSRTSHIALAAYGVVVIALSAAALGDRAWRSARRVTIAGVFLYTLTTGGGIATESAFPWIVARLWVLFPIAVLLAIIPFTHARHRRALIRVAAVGLVLGGLLRADQWGPDFWAMALTVFGTILAIGALDVTRPGALELEAEMPLVVKDTALPVVLFDAFLLPIGLFIATIAAAPDRVSLQSASIAILWTVLAAWMTHRTRAEPEADKYASTASLIALWIVPAAFFDHQLARVAGSVAMGMLLMITALRLNRKPFIAGGVGALILASVWALTFADARPAYEYMPFATRESLAAALAVVGWIALFRIARPADFLPDLDAKDRAALRVALITGGSVMAFLWGVAELEGAWNRTAATALLIVYYAATGTLMIWLGRTRDFRPLRLIGLGLALLAAGKAMVEAFELPNVAVRISVFFVVSAFLIAVGYWYRHGADDRR